MRQIRKRGGLDVPMNVFLYQEVQRIQHVIKLVRSDLLAVQLAIRRSDHDTGDISYSWSSLMPKYLMYGCSQ